MKLKGRTIYSNGDARVNICIYALSLVLHLAISNQYFKIQYLVLGSNLEFFSVVNGVQMHTAFPYQPTLT